jgi:tRNA 2-thiocytidine biosynthesis protein TtcA
MKDFTLPNHPFTKLGKQLESATRKALYDYEMLKGEKALVIGLSGGKDSLAMLFLLKAIVGRGFDDIKLYAVHVQEKFLSEMVDTNFLKDICNQLEVELFIESFSIKDKENFNCYLCSRIRRKIIFQKARDLNCKLVAFAHHRDDNTQTLLMNMLHKAEFSAMLPVIDMVKYGVRIIRPFIYLSEKDIINFAKHYNFYDKSCSCPYGTDTKRIAVEKYLSLMEKDFPNARSNLSKTALNFGSNKAKIP